MLDWQNIEDVEVFQNNKPCFTDIINNIQGRLFLSRYVRVLSGIRKKTQPLTQNSKPSP